MHEGGKRAALAEVKGDLFRVTVGNLAPGETAAVEMSFASLHRAEGRQVRCPLEARLFWTGFALDGEISV